MKIEQRYSSVRCVYILDRCVNSETDRKRSTEVANIGPALHNKSRMTDIR